MLKKPALSRLFHAWRFGASCWCMISVPAPQRILMAKPNVGLLLCLLLGAFGLAACSNTESESATAESNPPEITAPAAATPEPVEPTPQVEDVAGSQLADTAWSLVKIQSMDDSVAEPSADTAYTITFNADGRASMQVDCNRGAGSWESVSPGQLTFGPLALTRAMCPPGSIHDRFVRELEYVRTYVMRDGNLYLATMADGSILEFEPLAN
ncbi:META domain-containing protein [Marinihelvus fidelis]|uniref:META domain-containing protein n=1 Tax=Marinihelvus fidelis TaxID=2613842 RepID=A0A5N0T9P6_9GAMM|nr:META domain-containing protein [Marinihelvus fidelis]KAA9131660.1 META domain-containing protein [Marinihelvus fidelis]